MSGRFNLNDYVTVDERIDRFWADYPNGAIRTEMVYANNDGSSVAIIARIHKDACGPVIATGIAQELQGGANANKSSWWENCETSAIGRALANMGMSISKQRPSREEMAKVQRYQDEDARPAPRPQERPAPAPPAAPSTMRVVDKPVALESRPDPDAVLAILGEMDDAREPWHQIKKYADEQSTGRFGDDVLRIHDKLQAIARRRRESVKPPASVAG
jgi:hypothetical protein